MTARVELYRGSVQSVVGGGAGTSDTESIMDLRQTL